jgi:hypothetical protein
VVLAFIIVISICQSHVVHDVTIKVTVGVTQLEINWCFEKKIALKEI